MKSQTNSDKECGLDKSQKGHWTESFPGLDLWEGLERDLSSAQRLKRDLKSLVQTYPPPPPAVPANASIDGHTGVRPMHLVALRKRVATEHLEAEGVPHCRCETKAP